MIKHFCEYCDDGNGNSVYPYYGLAPHVHTQTIGGTEFTNEYPENFSPDDDGMGVYTHCLHCKPTNTIDQFIANDGFNKAFADVFGLPESVVESLGEVS